MRAPCLDLLGVCSFLQGRAKERELSLVREVPSGLIGYASAAPTAEGEKFKQGTFLLHEPVLFVDFTVTRIRLFSNQKTCHISLNTLWCECEEYDSYPIHPGYLRFMILP